MSKNSSTLSVFHLSMARVSAVNSSSSSSLITGSAPRTYLIVKPGYLLGRSLLIKACTCGYAPSRHPHTSSIALGYFVVSSLRPSSVQHFVQSDTKDGLTLNFDRSSHDEHNSAALLKPKTF